MDKMICSICNAEYVFDATKPEKAYLSFMAHLRNIHKMNRRQYIESGYIIDSDIESAAKASVSTKNKDKIRSADSVSESNERLLNTVGVDEYNRYPKCRICGFVGKQLFKHISNIHNITMDGYTTKFPNSVLALPEYYEYLSETRKGELNPMHNNGSTRNTPFHIDFYISRGHSIADAELMANAAKQKSKAPMTPVKQATRPEYYMIKHGVDYARAVGMVVDRQRTNSIENIAKRNNISIDDAKHIRSDITATWLNTMRSKPIDELIEINRKKTSFQSVSKISLNFIDSILKFTNIDSDSALYNTHELTLYKPDTESAFGYKFYRYDFTIGNKIIEFNGDMIHGNPSIYSACDYPLSKYPKAFSNKATWTAQQIWDYDAEKTRIANDCGYEVMVVWESEWKKNKTDVLYRVRDFLLGGVVDGNIR